MTVRIDSERRRALLGVFLFLAAASEAAASAWQEDFASGRLDPQRWERTRFGDFRLESADVLPREERTGYRLRLSADTRGTRDEIVKHTGVRTRCAVPIEGEVRLDATIDWGPPANASYLTAAIVISPHATTTDPTATADWLSLAYVGVPPRGNARLLVQARGRDGVKTLFADGWPDANRGGRALSRVEIALVWRDSRLEVIEDGRVVHRHESLFAPFASMHVYLQLSTHSNYAERSVAFEALRIATDSGIPVWQRFPAECPAGSVR